MCDQIVSFMPSFLVIPPLHIFISPTPFSNSSLGAKPFAQGDCAGEGMCGTCLVEVKEGEEHLNAPDGLESMITKGRPTKWRASCRTVLGPDNKPGHLRIVTKPQSAFANELNPGVRAIR